jgi:hypothetical protein
MPYNTFGSPVVPYGHPNDFSIYVNDYEYPAFIYLKIIKKINEMDSFEVNLMDVTSSDANVQYGRIIKIFSESTLILKGRIESVKYKTDGTTTIKGFGMATFLANKEYTLRNTWFDTTINLSNYFLSLNNDSASPWIITPGTIEDYGENIDFRSEFDNKLQIMDALARQLEWDWYIDNGDYPFNSDTFNLVYWRGSLAPTYSVQLSGTSQNGFISDRNDNMSSLLNSVVYMGKGEGTSQIWTKFSLVSTIYDKLDQTILDATSPMTLITASGFPTRGIAMIGRTPVIFTNKVGNFFDSMIQDSQGGTLNLFHYKGVLCILVYDATYAVSTSLASAIGSSDTTIYALDTSAFTDSGNIIVGTEIISYTSKTYNSFDGCTRGTNSTIAVSHDANVIVFNYDSTKIYTENNPQTGTTMSDPYIKIKQKNMVDPTKENERQLEMEASCYLFRNMTITYEITFEMMDYHDFLNNTKLGDNLQIIDSDSGLNDVYRYLSLDLTYDNGNVTMIVGASNKKIIETSFIDKVSNINKVLHSRLTYSPI